MKRLTYLMIAALLVSGGTQSAYARPGKKHGRQERIATRGADVGVHVVFSPRDLHVIREYYAPQYRSLPPGLQKKYARTGQLPPGWQKKLQPFPYVVERELVVLPAGYRRGVIDGHAVIYDTRTHAIVDVTGLH